MEKSGLLLYVLDGLDECAETDRVRLLDKLKAFHDKGSNATSRWISQILHH